ncbi:hypothetical protein ACFRCI_18470 [Streptomyces sp. NPDC056638]|uniref:hypothetical protein n=1 Tax=Streptomyces sp. NPDC056638 TaxID=3345887 RepID=UPI00369860EC
MKPLLDAYADRLTQAIDAERSGRQLTCPIVVSLTWRLSLISRSAVDETLPRLPDGKGDARSLPTFTEDLCDGFGAQLYPGSIRHGPHIAVLVRASRNPWDKGGGRGEAIG